MVEGLVTVVFKEIIDVQLDAPFPVLSYRDAVETYGSDRPDLRFDLPLVDFSELACQSDFNALKSAPCVKAIVIPDADSYSRKVIDGFSQFVMDYSSQEKKTPLAGVTWMRCKEGDLTGGIAKFLLKHCVRMLSNHSLWKRVTSCCLWAGNGRRFYPPWEPYDSRSPGAMT